MYRGPMIGTGFWVRHLMEIARRRELASQVIAGYVSGPAAATQATAVALTKTAGARTVILVEGISDQIALETLAVRRGRDLAADGVVVLPIGGAHAVTRYLRRFGPQGAGVRLAGLFDATEQDVLRRGLVATYGGSPGSPASPGSPGSPVSLVDAERLGFHLCVEDLEDELIRAAGAALVAELFGEHGDLGSFRRMSRQPAWRGRPEEAQMRRFLGAGSARKLRYARLLVEAISLGRMPRPLDAVLADA
jgi:hypothetical protein